MSEIEAAAKALADAFSKATEGHAYNLDHVDKVNEVLREAGHRPLRLFVVRERLTSN